MKMWLWIKTVSWRLIATAITIFVFYGFTGDITFSGGIGIFINIIKFFVYYLHERVWQHVKRT